MDKIATLSDWSEYVGINHERDYITAYPLDESPFYVVAKTWYADEMRRPGCVWTHSLLIHKDDLTKITDFCNLLRLFEAPHAEDYVNYSTPRSFEENAKEIETELNEIGVNRAADAYELLLSSTSAFILSEFSSQQSQELLLSLLNFIPIGILNRMSICFWHRFASYIRREVPLFSVCHSRGQFRPVLVKQVICTMVTTRWS